MAACVVAVEVTFIGLRGFPDSAEGLYGTFLSCCLAVLYSRRTLAPVLKSIWRASTLAPGRIWSWMQGVGMGVGSER